jgi:hypothetical protein
MENQIINGIELGSFEAISISLGQSKNENRDGKKSKFAVFTYQSTYSGRVAPVRDIIFEENLGSLTFETLMNYRKLDGENNPMRDSKGGYIVDIDAIYKAAEQADKRTEKRIVKTLIEVPGGMIVPYKLQGERYANDVDGQPVMDKQNRRVKKSIIKVFVQVQNIMPGPDGKPITNYVGGISPEVRGQELQDRFYREVVPVAAPVTEPAGETPDESVF